MIVHIFTAERYHLVPNISKGFVTTYKNDAQHLIVLCGSKNLDTQRYENVYKTTNFRDYIFCLSHYQLCKVLWKYRKTPIIFHGGDYLSFVLPFLLGCRNVSWVCWGYGASVRNTLRSKLAAPFKALIYRRFTNIITLMENDRDTIIRDFGVDRKNVYTMPYQSSLESPRVKKSLELLNQDTQVTNEKPLVLLGNNPSSITYYEKMMKSLSQYRGKIRVHCMMNYSLVRDERYERFIALGKSLFDSDFKSDEEFYQGDDYVNYMNSCDVYMCATPKQTGLGAINTCMLLGKKAYLTGKNLDWMRNHYGVLVYDVNTIPSYEEFVKPLTTEEKRSNREALLSKIKEHFSLWQQYLRKKNFE